MVPSKFPFVENGKKSVYARSNPLLEIKAILPCPQYFVIDDQCVKKLGFGLLTRLENDTRRPPTKRRKIYIFYLNCGFYCFS